MTGAPTAVRLSPTEHRDAVTALLSSRAAELEVRAAVRGRPPASLPREQADLWLADAHLDAGLREALGRLGRLAPGTPDPAGRLGRLRLPVAALVELGREFPDAALLLQAWQAALRRPGPARVMGIVNVTPDSFSDGGLLQGPDEAVAHGLKLLAAGADILDVGGESTRPGATPVPDETELERVLPVVAGLTRSCPAPVSIDTSKPAVARAALEGGATLVNDVRAGAAPGLLEAAAEHGAGVVLMHMRGSPRDMQAAPRYDDVVREVCAALRAAGARALRAGVDATHIALDPGLCFGKDLGHNLELMRALPELRSLSLPLVVGLSRKSFLGGLSGQAEARRRGPETGAATALAAFLGAEIHRVHEPAEARAALAVAGAVAHDPEPPR